MALPLNYRIVGQIPGNITVPGKLMLPTTPVASPYSNINQSVTIQNAGGPFVHNDNASPSFSPVKLGTRPIAMHSAKPPKPPDKPLMPYMRYSKKIWDSVKAKHPDLKLWEIGKIVGSMWREYPEEEKQELVEEWEAEKADYNVALKAYHQSAEYQAYLREKNSHSSIPSDREETPAPISVSTPKIPSSKPDVAKIALIPAAEDDDDTTDGFSSKHAAAARYTQNHLLIQEIFSDVMVPDARSVVTVARMNVLKRQVQSLTMHQQKLESELKQLEEKHQSKKRKFLESAEKFNEEYSKQCDFKVTKDQCDEFYRKHCETIKNQLQSESKKTPVVPGNTAPAQTMPVGTNQVKIGPFAGVGAHPIGSQASVVTSSQPAPGVRPPTSGLPVTQGLSATAQVPQVANPDNNNLSVGDTLSAKVDISLTN